MSNELDRVWKDVVVAYLKVYHASCLQGETMKILSYNSRLRVDVWAWDLPSVKYDCQPICRDVW
jgi:hypothetical protein